MRAPPTFAGKPTLEGHRIRLRPVTEADAPALLALLAAPEVRRLTGTHRSPWGKEPEQAERWHATPRR
ncbi:GNAT family N-acetyltransferase [Saccharomonospora glauca]|uniref:GNAT family N-acetyltransferase n=1 Tax=Saccharomonospora glauca TaxID=40990 RepID=UPI0038CDC9CF